MVVKLGKKLLKTMIEGYELFEGPESQFEEQSHLNNNILYRRSNNSYLMMKLNLFLPRKILEQEEVNIKCNIKTSFSKALWNMNPPN